MDIKKIISRFFFGKTVPCISITTTEEGLAHIRETQQKTGHKASSELLASSLSLYDFVFDSITSGAKVTLHKDRCTVEFEDEPLQDQSFEASVVYPILGEEGKK